MQILPDWSLDLTPEDVLRGQGADPAQIRSRRPSLLAAAEWALQEGLPLLEPAVQVQEVAVAGLRHERLDLAGGKALTGQLIVQHLAGAARVTVCLGTIGDQLETVASGVMPGDPLLGLALDGLGNAAVEQLATRLCSRLENQARSQGLETSLPLSPGMLGWPVDPGQRQLFSLLDPAALGVRLTDSLMMVPAKSLTFVVGFGQRLAYQGRTCDFCSLKDTCRYQDHYPSL